MTTINPIQSLLAKPQPATFDAPVIGADRQSEPAVTPANGVDVAAFEPNDRAARFVLPYVWATAVGVWTTGLSIMAFEIDVPRAIFWGIVVTAMLAFVSLCVRAAKATPEQAAMP